ncbi:MAG: tRNA (adenosine(37)-N6)-dimethylallyltransferase MiaA [Dehalococcoidia bacterium]|jgi:tRNA dimethylallyltransferase
MRCLVAIVGPTAIGKSTLGIQISQTFNGEIINADSRQIYRYMDIGTAKPSKAEQNSIPHHLLDIVDPDEAFSVALYQAAAYKIIEQVQAANKVPLMVGGSGQYIWSIVEGWQIPQVKPDYDFRDSLQSKAEASGVYELYRELREIDEATATKIDPNNLRRIIRALEIYHKTGNKPSELQAKMGSPFPVLIIGLTTGRHNLYTMIDKRTDRMITEGLVDEVKNLMDMGYTADLPSMSSLGYRQILMYLKGEIELDNAVQKIKYETHRFARGQYAWFHLADNRIKWFSVGDNRENQINYTIEQFLASLKNNE